MGGSNSIFPPKSQKWRNPLVLLVISSLIFLPERTDGSGGGLWQKCSLYKLHSKNATRTVFTSGLKNPQFESFKLRKLDQELSRCGRNGIDIREITISQLQFLFEQLELNSTELTICYLNRIQAMNSLKAVLEVNPDAIRIAAYLDSERVAGRVRGALHGIPILIKDNIATHDQTQTTSGSSALVGAKSKRDSKLVEQLRRAGAVLLGKASLSEFAYFRGTDEQSGWSGRAGQAISPYALGQDPSGSSTGSATGVAANLCVVSIGTETDGSIISPSSRNSVVGLKPTVGRVSTDKVIPISFTQDSVGPIGRTVQDVATLFQYMVPNPNSNSFKKELGCFNAVNRLYTVGVPRDPFWNVSFVAVQGLEFALKALASAGVKVIDPIIPASGLLSEISGDKEFVVMLHEFKWGLNRYLDQDMDLAQARSRSLGDVINYNIKHPVPEGYNQVTLLRSELTNGLGNKTYLGYREQNQNAARRYLNSLMKNYNLDAIATPSENEDSSSFPASYSTAAIAGYPIINVPVGTVSTTAMPFGMSFIGLPHSEMKLLQIAHLLEKQIQGRKIPQFVA